MAQISEESDLSPFSKLFRHHEEYALRLVATTPSPRASRAEDAHDSQGHRPQAYDPLTDPFVDHVVRGARSSGNVNQSSTSLPDAPLHNSLEPPVLFALPPLGDVDPNNPRKPFPGLAGLTKDSPTPSLKKHKAEQILKQHGSPPNVRVTAGGRIVPSEQSPLCSPRYGYSAINRNGGLIKFAPGYPPQPKTLVNVSKSLPNGFVAQDTNGKLYQVVDGRFLQIQEVNGIPQLFITAPNITNVAWGQFHAAATGPAEESHSQAYSQAPGLAQAQVHLQAQAHSQAHSQPHSQAQAHSLASSQANSQANSHSQAQAQTHSQANSQAYSQAQALSNSHSQAHPQPPRRPATGTESENGPSKLAQIAALEKQYQKLEAERRSLDKAEVFRRNELTGKHFTNLIQKRRELVNSQDELRRSIKLLKEDSSAVSSNRSRPSPEAAVPHFSQSSDLVPSMPSMPWMHDAPFAHSQSPVMLPTMSMEHPILPHHSHVQGHLPPFVAMHMMHPGMIHVGNSAHSSAFTAQQQFSHPAPVEVSTGAEQHQNREPLPARLAVAGQRSALNPMSPAYQPSSKSNVSQTHQSGRRASSQQRGQWRVRTSGTRNDCKDSDSPGTRSSHPPSSNASYATADFFPNDPREHSLYKHNYPIRHDGAVAVHNFAQRAHPSQSEESVAKPELEHHNPSWNPTIPDQAFQGVTADHDQSNDRSLETRATDVAATFSRATSNEAVERALGFSAGLARQSIGGQRSKAYLDGYCEGLLQSANVDTLGAPHSASATEVAERLPAVHVGTVEAVETPASDGGHLPEPLVAEAVVASFKEAVRAPSNENAILSPSLSGPSVDDAGKGKTLGAWAKASDVSKEDDNKPQQAAGNEGHVHVSNSQEATAVSIKAIDFAGEENVQTHHHEQEDSFRGSRTFSAQTQPAHHMEASLSQQRVYAPHRILSSPAFDWKVPNSLAQATSHATGFFAHFDGTASKPESAKTEDAIEPVKQVLPQTSKFQEASLPEVDIAPSSSSTAATVKSPSPSPKKSPTKAKFVAMAGKAGIKVAATTAIVTARPPPCPLSPKGSNNLEPMSPQERRRWRDVWKKRNNADT